MKSIALAVAVAALCGRASAADLEPGLVGEYFSYRTEGYVPELPAGARPFLMRVDKQVNFPDPGTGGDFHHTKLVYNFAARWTGVLRVGKAGEYTLFTRSDDGARLTIDGKKVLENDGPHPLSEKSATVRLSAGDHPIKLEFAQGGGGSACVLSWQPPGGKKDVVPASALLHEKGAAEAIAWDKKAWEDFRVGGNNVRPRQDNTQWGQMDYGPFLSHTIGAPAPGNNVTLKGVAVKLDGGRAGFLFDTQLMRMSAAWTGGFLQLKGVAFDGVHGPSPEVAGNVHVSTSPGPGWARPGTTDFTDQRPEPFGPLPKEWMHYKGLYRHGDQVVFSYAVGATDVLESPGVAGIGDAAAFTRAFHIGPSTQSLTLLVVDLPGAGEGIAFNDLQNSMQKQPAQPFFKLAVTGTEKDKVLAAAVPGPDAVDTPQKLQEFAKAVKDAKWQTVVVDNRTRLYLTLPAHADPLSFVLYVDAGKVKKDLREAFKDMKFANLPSLVKGGPTLWPQKMTTKGKLGTPSTTDPNAAAYVVDTIEPPVQNPWNSWIRFGGFDFFPDGKSAALCTWSGDVWVVSGIDEKLEKLTWKRYASGLFQPLGLKILDGKVYVHGRDQITRLHDLNGDGEADFYENFNNDVMVTSGFHEFAFDLQTDQAGNFYFAKAGPVNPGGGGFGKSTGHNGSLMRVSKDGAKLDVVATGFRAPNGIGVSPDGQITTGDNQGTWTPACRINWVRPGGFYGVVDLAHRTEPPTRTDNPLCWLPYAWDNSSGSQVWVSGDKWGEAFKGDLLHLSYGKCRLFKVLIDEGDPENVQGGVVRFPIKFDSGAMRSRVNPGDGQLYVCGLRGWQSEAATDACFQRVRYTGKPVYMVDAMKVRTDGIELTFTQPLKEDVADDAGSFGVEQWNYRWTGEYGSDEYSAKEPGRKGRDAVGVKSAKLRADGKTVFLEMEGLRPVMQMLIKYDLEAKDGTAMRDEVACTLNVVGDRKMVVSSGK